MRPVPGDDSLIIDWVRVRVWPWQHPECVITGEKIPPRAMAYKRKTEYLIRDEVTTIVEWVSEQGYILEKLKGNA